MTVDKAVFLMAGILVLVGLVLGYYVNAWWFLLTAFTGLNMVQTAFTGICPGAIMMKKLGLPCGRAFN